MPNQSASPEGHGDGLRTLDQALFEDVTRRQMMARAGGALLATSALGGLLAACGGSTASSQGAGDIGGALPMLIWEGYDSPKASAPFRKKYGVTVKTELVGSNSEVITKLLAGGARSTAVVTPGNGLIPLLVQAGVLDPMDLSKMPNASKLAPRFQKLSKTQLDIKGQTYAVPLGWGLNTLVYNAKYVSPKSYMELTKPEYTNKVGFWDDLGNIQCWATVLGYDALNMNQAELNKVTDFIINLKRTQGRIFTSDTVVMAKAIAGGDVITFGSPIWTYVATTLAKQQGSNSVKWTVPDKGSVLWVDTWALPKGGPNRSTAYAWIDWMVGKQANTIMTEELSEGPVNGEAFKEVAENSKTVASTADLYSSEIDEKSQLFGFPLGTNGTVTYQDWTNAWKRVQAA